MDRERLLELRAEHYPCPGSGGDEPHGDHCINPGECWNQVWPCEQSQILDLALEAERLREQLQRSRQHAKGIVQGGSPKEIAESIIAEHLDEVPRGAHRAKLDDELCRVCALASMILNAEGEAERLRAALEDAITALEENWLSAAAKNARSALAGTEVKDG